MAYRYIHEWTRAGREVVFHTIPMIHVGSEAYYSRVSQLIDTYNHVLVEGVPPSATKEIGSYRRIARLAGLTTQIDGLKPPPDLSVTNIDMDGRLFANLFHKLPLWSKLQLFILDRLLVSPSMARKLQFRKLVEEAITYPQDPERKLVDPATQVAFCHEQKPELDLLIENRRNQQIQEHLQQYITTNSGRRYRLDVGILFGDAHMPHIYETLRTNAFRWRLEEKLVVM
jgi:hypothetical protein